MQLELNGRPLLDTVPAGLFGASEKPTSAPNWHSPKAIADMARLGGIREAAGALPITQLYAASPLWDIRQVGAVDITGATDMRGLLEEAFAAAPIGSTLYVPPGVLKVSKATALGAAYCLQVTRQVNLWCDGVIRADLSDLDSAIDIFNIAVSDAGGNGDVRNMQWRLRSFFNGGGRSSIRLEPNLPVIRFALLGGGIQGLNGPAAFFGGNIAGTICERVDVSNGLEFGEFGGVFHADQITVKSCNIHGDRTAVKIDAIFGAYTHLIQGNFLVSKNGAVDIVNGSQVKILDNQIEQNGLNAHPYTTSIAIQGTRFASESCDILGNNFGGGTNVNYSILTVNANKTAIDRNDFNVPGSADIVLASSGTRNTKIGSGNRYRGGSRGANGLSDLYLSDQGIANVGYNRFVMSLINQNGWSSADLSIRVSDNVAHLSGTLTGGTLTTGTLIGTLPLGYRPFAVIKVSVYTNAGGGWIQISTNGQVTVVSLPGGTVDCSGVHFSVLGDV